MFNSLSAARTASPYSLVLHHTQELLWGRLAHQPKRSKITERGCHMDVPRPTHDSPYHPPTRVPAVAIPVPHPHSLAGLDTMHGQRATGYQAGLTKSDDGLWCDRIPPSSLARAAPRAQRRKPLATWPAQDAATLSAYELYSGRSIRPVTAPGLSRWLE